MCIVTALGFCNSIRIQDLHLDSPQQVLWDSLSLLTDIRVKVVGGRECVSVQTHRKRIFPLKCQIYNLVCATIDQSCKRLQNSWLE